MTELFLFFVDFITPYGYILLIFCNLVTAIYTILKAIRVKYGRKSRSDHK